MNKLTEIVFYCAIVHLGWEYGQGRIQMSRQKSILSKTFIKLRNSAALATLFIAATSQANAVGVGPGGVDLLHVPISWCPVIGSPAQANPNLNGDTETDAILWRRHERPTDNIYINTAGITFRSAINNAWTVLDFPQLADPNTALATPGDVRGEDVNAFGNEYNALITACDAAYSALGRANVGVTAINVGLFHDAAGTYVGVIGWGGCSQPMGAHTTCGAPYDGRIAVIDNIYLHPASPDRTFPGTNTSFVLTDPFDQLVGHELGHALGLDHVTGNTLLMNPSSVDDNGDGQIDNVVFAAGQTTVARDSSNIVPGLEIDPPLKVDPGDFIADRIMDGKDDMKMEPWQDLASVRLSLDKKLNRVYISNQLAGIHQKNNNRPSVHWIIMNTSGDGKGGNPEQVAKLGLTAKAIGNADIVIRVDVRFPETRASAWRWNGVEFEKFPRIFSELQTLEMTPYLVDVPGLKTPDIGNARIYDTVVASLPAKSAGIRPGQPVTVDVIVEDIETKKIDRLSEEKGDRTFVLEDPDFPHCYVLNQAKPGGKVTVLVEGLLPKQPFHALVGPEQVATGETDNRGNSKFELPIPPKARPGLHLVTIGIDKTALTADCAVQVADARKDDERKKPKHGKPGIGDLMQQHLELLKESLDVIREMNKNIR